MARASNNKVDWVDIFSKYRPLPLSLRREGLKWLLNCECDALGGECRCREPHAEQNGQLSASGVPPSTHCKLGPAPSVPPIEREIQVTSSNGARNPVKNGAVPLYQTQGRHKLVRYDSVDKPDLYAKDHSVTTEVVCELYSSPTNPITHLRSISTRQEKQRISTKELSFAHAYDGLRNPYVVVINNVNFCGMVDPRHGATADWKNWRTFFNKAGFETVKYYPDQTECEMMGILDDIVKSQNSILCKHDAFIFVVMSHGSEKGVMGTHGKYIDVEKITEKFQANKCPSLAKKPKLFFINACRGIKVDAGCTVQQDPCDCDVVDGISDGGEFQVKHPSEADFLICYSTTKGHVSYRQFFANPNVTMQPGELIGSWFISVMVKVFGEYATKEDLLSMLTRVNREMCELRDTSSGNKQISCHLSMLTRKLYFMNFLNNDLGCE